MIGNLMKIVFALAFSLFFLKVSALACTCVRDKIKVNGFSGQVFAVSESNPDYKELLPKATIRLLDRNDRNKVIAEVLSDENGKFALESVKAGTYLLEAEARHFGKVVTQIKIAGKSKQSKSGLIIGLEPGIVCCGGYVKKE